MQRKKIAPKIVLPGLFFDGEAWVPAETYPNYLIFTDKVLAETLNVSRVTVGEWRASGLIPYTTSGSSAYAIYNLNAVLNALQRHGYRVDPNLKSRDDEK